VLSKDPDRRGIGGASSGAIAAFTVAWERPESFGKVVSHIGSFTNIRGGHVYPGLIRKTKAKPIRVFLQDGSNDLDNLRYDNIKKFDAVFLNNTVGMVFVDPGVREGLTRFVREGGGLAGNHGVSHASMDWPEFSEMIGVRRGVHREPTEQAWIHVEDPHSPLTAPFDGQSFLYQDEFFRFPNPPYSREKLHILLTMDVAKTDMNQGRPCASPCVRADADYAVSWIHKYGQGRVFFSILGHNPTIFTTPLLARYFLNGIQFILGDLDADATPSARQAGRRASRR